MQKVSYQFIVVIIAIVSFFNFTCAFAEEQQSVQIEYASLTTEVQQLSDPKTWFTYFASTDTEAEISEEARYPQYDPNYIITTMTSDGISIEYDEYGMFWIDIESDIPISYRSEGEGMYLPPATTIEGKYTQTEAEELALKFLSDVMGIDISQLEMQSVTPEDVNKERSRAYRFVFGYQYNGISVARAPLISIAVNDDGIVQANAETVLCFKPNEPADTSKLLSKEEIISKVTTLSEQSPCMPVYYLVNLSDVRIAWMFNYAVQDSGITLNGWAYDMLSGIELESELG